ncbi:MAG: hypothetical protein JSV63_03990 [Candidatus Aenigmatarchaeota archaeon]|nr:MAG: hypothetical protein JSV63_03990 [Candidatus Aenigmarchaeota archaeon]
MITESEIKVLEYMSRQLLAKQHELESAFGEEDGVMSTLQKLEAMDYVKVVEPIGEKCFVITQKGTRILRDAKNPEKRAAAAKQQGFLTS